MLSPGQSSPGRGEPQSKYGSRVNVPGARGFHLCCLQRHVSPYHTGTPGGQESSFRHSQIQISVRTSLDFPLPSSPSSCSLSLIHTHTHTHTHTPLISHLFFPIYWLHDFLFLLGSADTKPKMALNIRLRLFLEKLRMSKAGKHTPSQDPP